MKIAAIIVAAGSGSRMGTKENKLLLKICGKTVIERTLENISTCSSIDKVILVTSDSGIIKISEIFSDNITIVAGGKTRTESVLNGLIAAEGFDLVAIHDGARPLVTNEIIYTTIEDAKIHGAAITGTDVFDTIKKADEQGFIINTPARKSLKSVQTPQVFNRELLLVAYRSCPCDVTDDASVAENAGIKIKISKGSRENIKITTQFDILLAETILKEREIK